MDTNILIPGSTSPTFISESISKYQPNTTIGARSIFEGQVCPNDIGGKTVQAIEYIDNFKSEGPIFSNDFLK